MKTKHDPRHEARARTMQALFSFSFNASNPTDQKEKKVIDRLDKIDAIIAKSAPLFPVDKIAKIDLAILRLAVYELILEKKNPPKVIIDEAVELAKEFGGESSSAFVNGVLGSVLLKENNYGRKNR